MISMNQDPAYLERIFYSTRCPLCWTDKRPKGIAGGDCSVCGVVLPPNGLAVVSFHAKGISVFCGIDCLLAVTHQAAHNDPCPYCGRPPLPDKKRERFCRACGAQISPEAETIGVSDAGRVYFLCNARCLSTYLKNEERFCG